MYSFVRVFARTDRPTDRPVCVKFRSWNRCVARLEASWHTTTCELRTTRAKDERRRGKVSWERSRRAPGIYDGCDESKSDSHWTELRKDVDREKRRSGKGKRCRRRRRRRKRRWWRRRWRRRRKILLRTMTRRISRIPDTWDEGKNARSRIVLFIVQVIVGDHLIEFVGTSNSNFFFLFFFYLFHLFFGRKIFVSFRISRGVNLIFLETGVVPRWISTIFDNGERKREI